MTSSTLNPKTPSGSLQWLGHASAVYRTPKATVLFDPLGRSRTRAAGLVDVILITHAHIDHLNRWSLAAAPRSAELVVPKGAGGIVADMGFAKVTEVSAGDELARPGLEITAVPTCHDNGRWRKTATPECCGYVVRSVGEPHAIHHAGDVDFSDHRIFDELGKRHNIFASMLPIGGMLPVWYYRMRRRAFDRGVHIDPDAALAIFERMGAQRLVPVHWGTVNLRLGPPSMPAKRLAQIAQLKEVSALVHILQHAESIDVPR